MDKNQALIALSESEDAAFGREAIDAQSPAQRVFSSVWAVESEVNNGGFQQYFANSSSETAPYVVEALETIGALRAAAICRQAIACGFPEGLPSDPSEIERAAERFSDATSEALATFDDAFTAYPDDLTSLLYAFVSQRPEEFGAMPR